MKQIIFVIIFALLTKTASFGQDIDTTCFIGMSINCNSNGVVLSKSLILLERIQNPSTKQIIINTILIDTTGKVTKNSSMVLLVNENNEFTISDTKKTTSGNGKLFGPEWNWTYLSGDYKSLVGVTIKDQDFFSDPSIFTSRKEIILPNGSVVLTMDITATKISRTEYEILTKAIK
ncbi:MAG TPA: hypothetical protein VIK14_12495 [Ignavibacteria bacterium]